MTREKTIFPAFEMRFRAEMLKRRLTTTYNTGNSGAPAQSLPQAGVRPLKQSHPIAKWPPNPLSGIPRDWVTKGNSKKTNTACAADPNVFTTNRSTSRPSCHALPFLNNRSFRRVSMAGNRQEKTYKKTYFGFALVHIDGAASATFPGHAASATPPTTPATPTSCIHDSDRFSTKYTNTTCHTRIVCDKSGTITPGSLAAPIKLRSDDTASTNPIPRNIRRNCHGSRHALGASFRRFA
mmetsp:Transcript_14587/g.41564  ORF Transcript_14587/g.41564 Transcript_14587/m.41564 type:complete len:238 (-) Transcript_14587:349-1062(-)